MDIQDQEQQCSEMMQINSYTHTDKNNRPQFAAGDFSFGNKKQRKEVVEPI